MTRLCHSSINYVLYFCDMDVFENIKVSVFALGYILKIIKVYNQNVHNIIKNMSYTFKLYFIYIG